MTSPDEYQTHINAVKTYLEREFPGATVSHIPSGSWFNQTVETLRIDGAEGWHILKVTRNCLMDTPDISKHLMNFQVSNALKKAGQTPVLVTAEGLLDSLI